MEKMMELILSIKTDFGNAKYVELSGDRKFQKVSPKLNRLWYSKESMSIASIDTRYHRVFDMFYPQYTAEVFTKEAVELREQLEHEFAQIKK